MRVENIDTKFQKSFLLQNKKTNNYSQKQNLKQETKKEIFLHNYQTIPFKRSWQEHKSWGAIYDPNKQATSFKLFAYPDCESVCVEVLKNNKYKSYPLVNKGGGIFETDEPIKDVADGDKYHYVIQRRGKTEKTKDPYSFKQPDFLGDSEVYDQTKYNWNDKDWYLNNKNRVSRLADSKNGLNSVDNLKIYELNCSSFTDGGDFESVKQKIKKISKSGFNAIEIMPVENTYSFNWGYDGVDKFAPNESLGGPDKLKELVDYIHNSGLNVIMDIVPNHFGCDGCQLSSVGPYIKGDNIFGSSINYEGKDSTYVRDYIVNAALNWIDNFHCDGLRVDMTKFMDSDITMKQMAMEINYHRPDAFLIAEDARYHMQTDGQNFWTDFEKIHDERVVFPLSKDDIGHDDTHHQKLIENIMQTSVAKLGYDSEWDFEFFHSLNDYLLSSSTLERLILAMYQSGNRVKYLMSHDEIGNCDGTRLIPKLMINKLNINRYLITDDYDEKRAIDYAELKKVSNNEARRIVRLQKAQLISEKLATMLQTGMLNNNEDIYRIGIDKNSGMTIDDVKKAFNESFAQQKAALALTYIVPGPKMVFQGDESSDLTPFRFFREFSDSSIDNKILTTEKGYSAGKSALYASKLGNINYSNSALRTTNQARKLTKMLNAIEFKNPEFVKNNTVLHPYSKVMAFNIVDSDNDIFVISNFSDITYPNQNAGEYYIDFPKGNWVEVLNTDDKKFGGLGCHNEDMIRAKISGEKLPIKLPANSTLYFKKV